MSAAYVFPGRVYCDQDYHPIGDAEAAAWCENYHQPTGPRIPASADSTIKEAPMTV